MVFGPQVKLIFIPINQVPYEGPVIGLHASVSVSKHRGTMSRKTVPRAWSCLLYPRTAGFQLFVLKE